MPFTLVATAFVAWFVLLRPTGLGGPASYLLVSGASMEPTLEHGDLAIMKRVDAYGPGDVAAFRVPRGEPGAGALVIHRIVGGSTVDGFVTQGDNKLAPDGWRPMPTDVVGTLWFVLPGAGPYLTWLRNPAVFGALAAALAVFTIMIGGESVWPRRWRPRPLALAWASVRRPRQTSTPTAPVDPYAWTVARGLAVCGRASRRSQASRWSNGNRTRPILRVSVP